MNKRVKTPLKPTPTFANEGEERAYWEAHDSTEHLDWSKARSVSLPNLKPTTKTISLRLPPSQPSPSGGRGQTSLRCCTRPVWGGASPAGLHGLAPTTRQDRHARDDRHERDEGNSMKGTA